MTKEALEYWYANKRDSESLTAKIASKNRTEHLKRNIEAKEKREHKQFLKDNRAHLEAMKERGEI
jgi:hypothetical protein